METKNLFDLVPKSNNAGKGQSLYKKELFEGKTPKECKALRCKLRRNRDNFIDAVISSKSDKNVLENFKKNWKEYAKATYIDVNSICEANANEQTQSLCNSFLQIIAEKTK